MEINGKTKILGVIGDPIEHTASPQMHNNAIKKRSLNYTYLPIHIAPQSLKAGIEGIKAMGVAGFNVTVPHKVSIIELLDEISEEAKAIGAVNTVKSVNGRLVGYNTDGQGFVNDFESKFKCSIANKNVVVLGAGGAARSIVVALVKSGVKSVVIANRTLEKAEDIKNCVTEYVGLNFIKTCFIEDVYEFIERSDVLINATSVGMYPDVDKMPINPDKIVSQVMFYDIVYNPSETSLMRELTQKGSLCVNGKGMLAGQGAIAFEIFTGEHVSVEEMESYL